ncbi:MAG: hypothetical protein N2Z72_04475 [Bacteroidales bacterium]|nr:hypothetical protein [Bacteroidales bacterium]
MEKKPTSLRTLASNHRASLLHQRPPSTAEINVILSLFFLDPLKLSATNACQKIAQTAANAPIDHPSPPFGLN